MPLEMDDLDMLTEEAELVMSHHLHAFCSACSPATPPTSATWMSRRYTMCSVPLHAHLAISGDGPQMCAANTPPLATMPVNASTPATGKRETDQCPLSDVEDPAACPT